jgi:hypothetical protein
MLAMTTMAQKQFDSAAYLHFNESRWEKVDFANLMKPSETIQELTTEEKIAGLSKCWAEAKYNFANFDLVPLLNWDSVYQAYIPKVINTTSTEAYYNVLRNFYQQLRDGHTAIVMPGNYFQKINGTLPIEVRWIENKVIVTGNTSTIKGDEIIKPGMELFTFDGQEVQQYIQKDISPYISFSTPQDSIERIYRKTLLPGPAGSQVALGFKDDKGHLITKTLTRVPVAQFWNPYPLVVFKVLKGNIGYLQLNSFNNAKVVDLFDSLFTAIAATKALIIDVRNNGGGNGGNGFQILGCLTNQPFLTGKFAVRQYKPVGRSWGGVEQVQLDSSDWKPYKNQLYSKPVVVLTSGATYSAAEDFTATFKSMKRGKVFGQPTGGSTGQPVFFSLPGGGAGYVCSKRDLQGNGAEFVGIGIQPDVSVYQTVKGIKDGKDEVLDAAVKYLQASN